MKLLTTALLLAGVAGAQAPVFDSSGNKLLNGSDYFRYVAYTLGDTDGDIGEALTLYGNVTFDGNGNYTMNCQELDTGNGVVQSVSMTGTYVISASGYGYLSSPVTTGVNIYGLVSNGIFIGSSTEQTVFSDLMIAAPAASSSVASSVFTGSYFTAYFVPSGSISDSEDASFQLNPNAGSLGTVNLTGYVGEEGSTVLTQSSANVKYVISNGAANIMFPNSSTANFIAGNEYAYITPDGNFIFGGSPANYDMFVGVKTGSSSGFGGLYYTAGLDENESTYTSGYADLNTYYGSFVAGSGNIIGHERFTSALSTTAKTFGFTYTDSYSFASNGAYTDSETSMQYVVGDGGSIRIGLGIGPLLGISVAIKAPNFTGSGVFLSPVGIENAASSAPFTAGVAPGEFITLYGSNLAPGEQVASVPFPNILNGVQVLINDVAAPIYYVSPNQVSVIVPYETTDSIAEIQVKNAGVTSNAVTLFVNKTAPGVFSQSENGLGLAAALHSDFSLVTESNPAVGGETVLVYLTGIGAVVPPVADGAAGPSSPLSVTTNTIAAAVGGQAAAVTFAGLAPGFAGLYQVNLTMPSGLTSGNLALDIIGPDSLTSEAVLPVSGTAAATASEQKRSPDRHGQ